MKTSIFLIIGFVIALSALGYAMYLYKKVLSYNEGEDKVKEISSYIKEGAQAFLRSEYKVIYTYIAVATTVIFIGFYFGYDSLSGLTSNSGTNIIVEETENSDLFYGIGTALAFLLGSFFSLAAGYIGMKSATNANSRTATAAQESGIISALDVAFKGGSVMGMGVVGFGLLGLLIVITISMIMLELPSGSRTWEIALWMGIFFSLAANSAVLFLTGGSVHFCQHRIRQNQDSV